MQALLLYFTYYCGIIFTVIDNRESQVSMDFLMAWSMNDSVIVHVAHGDPKSSCKTIDVFNLTIYQKFKPTLMEYSTIPFFRKKKLSAMVRICECNRQDSNGIIGDPNPSHGAFYCSSFRKRKRMVSHVGQPCCAHVNATQHPYASAGQT